MLRRCLVTLVACLIVALTVNDSFGQGFRRNRYSCSSCSGTSASENAVIDESPIYEAESQLLNAVNAIREKYGLRALILDVQLHRSARRHCGWMANSRQMIHSSGHAENIAMGQVDSDAVMTAWFNSSGHRANILNPRYTKIGVSGYLSPDGSPFWCQQFE